MTDKDTSMNNIPDTTLAWLAAIIDGEGSVMLTNKKTKNGGLSYRARIKVSNTDYRMMQALVDKTGINRIFGRRRQPNLNHKDYYEWTMEAGELRGWLPLLIPWLICKQEQATLLLEYLTEASVNMALPGKTFDPSPKKRKHEIAAEIHRLNKKGKNT